MRYSNHRVHRPLLVLVGLFPLGFGGFASAQEEVVPKSETSVARTAAQDGWLRGELRRRHDVARQVAVIQYVRWLNGLPPTVPLSAPLPPDRASYYAYGGPSLWSLAGGVFEPWPDLQGDIWGFSYDRPVRQSVGQRQVQTGLNRWESFPIYGDRVPPKPKRWGPVDY